jgi:DNA damage-inducible protein 1
MQGRDVDLLFGLDMLKAHQACIDLEKGVLRIQGREVRFLAEHELPEKSRRGEIPPEAVPVVESTPLQGSSGGSSGRNPVVSRGAGSSRSPGLSRPLSASRYPESNIRTIMDLGGVSREVAISTLDAAGGNVDVAASLLF